MNRLTGVEWYGDGVPDHGYGPLDLPLCGGGVVLFGLVHECRDATAAAAVIHDPVFDLRPQRLPVPVALVEARVVTGDGEQVVVRRCSLGWMPVEGA